jgi:hypothetical protein
MVRGRQSIDLKPCKVKLNTRYGAPARTTIQAVPENPRVGINAYSPGYKANWHTP